MSRHPITCHILDTTVGLPARDVKCTLLRVADGPNVLSTPTVLGTALTNADGRVARWTSPTTGSDAHEFSVAPGIYQIKFETLPYFQKLAAAKGTEGKREGRTFFPGVEIQFIVEQEPDAHYHIPLLLSNYSYSTYRGS